MSNNIKTDYMKYTIEDLRNGKCAVKNDGTLEELKEVLKLAFPNSGIRINGNSSYYFKNNQGYLDNFIYSNLPIQSVKDFLKTEKEPGSELKRGDWVYVNNTNNQLYDSSIKRIFLSYIEGSEFPYICVADGSEKLFKDKETFLTENWKNAEKVEEVVMTIAEIEEKLGIKNLKIKVF